MIVNIHEAKTQLSRLLEQVQAGEQVIIAKAGKPIADLVLHRPVTIKFGTLRGQMEWDDALFDEPDQEILDMFYGPR